jgi:hypothetical protein
MEETIRTVHGENFAEPKAQIGNGLNGISECDGRGEGLDSFLEATRDRGPKNDCSHSRYLDDGQVEMDNSAAEGPCVPWL